MTIQELSQILSNQCLDGSFTLHAHTLTSNSIASLLANHLPNQTLIISDAQVSINGESVEVSGKSSLLGCIDTETCAKFLIISDEVQLQLEILTPPDWKVVQSFPPVQNKSYLFDSLPLTSGKFTIASFDNSGFQTGINFQAGLSLADTMPELHTFVGLPNLNFGGPVQVNAEGYPTMTLTDLLKDINELELLNMPMSIELNHQIKDKNEIDSFFRLKSGLRFNAGDELLEIPMSAKFGYYYSLIDFEADLRGITINSLALLGKAYTGIDFGLDQLEAIFKDAKLVTQGITLSDFNLLIDIRKKSVVLASFGIVTNQPLIINDGLKAEKISLMFIAENPGQSGGRLICELTGELNLQSTLFNISVALPDARVSAYMLENQQIELIPLIRAVTGMQEVNLPQGFPAINFSNSYFHFNHAQKTLSVGGKMSTDWAIIPGLINIKNVGIEVDLGWKDQTTLAGQLTGAFEILNIQVYVAAKLANNKSLKLSGHIPEIQLSELIRNQLGSHVDLPEFLPDVAFKDLELSIDPLAKEYSISGSTITSWKIGDHFIEATLSLSLSNTNGTFKTELILEAKADPSLTIVDNMLEFQNTRLSFNLENNEWSVKSHSAFRIFEHEIAFKSEIKNANKSKKLLFKSEKTTAHKLLQIDNVASIDYEEIGIIVERTATNYNWEFYFEGGLIIEPEITLQGKVELSKKDDKYAIDFKPKESKIELILLSTNISHLNENIVAKLELGTLSFQKTANDWNLEASSELSLIGLPKAIGQMLNADKPNDPFSIKSSLTISPKYAEITLKSPYNVAFEFPKIQLNGADFEPGKGAIGIKTLSLKIGKELDLFFGLNVALPEKINHILGGTNDSGKANLDLFKSYEPGNIAQSGFEIGLSVGTRGVSANVISSPLKSDVLQIKKNESATECILNLGEYGKIRFDMPELSVDFKSSSLKAKGGFKVIDQLSMPIFPIAELLRKLKIDEEIISALPVKIPIKGISIYDEESKQFKGQVLVDLLKDYITIPDLVNQAIVDFSKHADLLPDSLKPYFNIEIPQSLFFDLEVTGDMSLKCNVSVFDPKISRKDQADVKPIKLLMPGRIPTVLGVEFYGFSIGQLWAGSFLLAEIDMIVDQFDLVEIAASMIITSSAGDKNPLASSRDLHSRFIVRNLYMPIFYYTGVPIPIPLFYDQLGFETTTLLGGNFQTHIGFPRPQISIMGFIKGIAQLKNFFTDENYFLDPAINPTDFKFELDLSRNFLKLPDYLGGHTLGITGDLKFDSYKIAASGLNLLKRPSFKGMVDLIPQENRIGHLGGKPLFGPVYLPQLHWMITTQDEFKTMAPQNDWNLTPEQKQTMLDIVPYPKDKTVDGIIVFLAGNWRAGIIDLETSLGLSVNNGQFAAGLHFHSDIYNLVTLDLRGKLNVTSAPVVSFDINGHCTLVLANTEIFRSTGSISFTNDRLSINGGFKLFNQDNALFNIIGGMDIVIGSNQQKIAGQVNMNLLADLFKQESQLEVTEDGIFINSVFLGQNTVIQIGRSVEKNETVLNFKLPVFDFNTQLRVGNDGMSMNGELSAHFAGLTFYSNLSSEGPRVTGDTRLNLASLDLFSGTASFDQLGIKLDVQSILPPIPGIFSMSTSLTGHIDDKGIDLDGRSQISLGVGIFAFNSDFTAFLNSSVGFGFSGKIFLGGISAAIMNFQDPRIGPKATNCILVSLIDIIGIKWALIISLDSLRIQIDRLGGTGWFGDHGANYNNWSLNWPTFLKQEVLSFSEDEVDSDSSSIKNELTETNPITLLELAKSFILDDSEFKTLEHFDSLPDIEFLDKHLLSYSAEPNANKEGEFIKKLHLLDISNSSGLKEIISQTEYDETLANNFDQLQEVGELIHLIFIQPASDEPIQVEISTNSLYSPLESSKILLKGRLKN